MVPEKPVRRSWRKLPGGEAEQQTKKKNKKEKGKKKARKIFERETKPGIFVHFMR